MAVQRKQLRVEIKDADKGQIEAVFSTFNVVDHDGDVTLPGAFKDGAPVRISAYGHSSWFGNHPPIGKGVIKLSDTDARLVGGFFLDMVDGAETFKAVKHMGELQEWSYGFDVIEAESGEHEGKRVRFLKKLEVHEVSPVLKGAGIDTHTVLVKRGAGRPVFELVMEPEEKAAPAPETDGDVQHAAAKEALRYEQLRGRVASIGRRP